MPATIEELAYETSNAALQRQEGEIVQLRARTGMLLAAGSLVASFFGAQALSRAGTAPWGALAIIAFVVSVGACVYLLAPKKNLSFAQSGSALYDEIRATSMDEAHLEVAAWLDGQFAANQPVIDRLNRFFAGACAALIGEVVFWTLALAGTIDTGL